MLYFLSYNRIVFAGTAVDDAHAKSHVDPMAHVGNQRAVKRRDSRRHTLANGVDFNMVSLSYRLRICGTGGLFSIATSQCCGIRPDN